MRPIPFLLAACLILGSCGNDRTTPSPSDGPAGPAPAPGGGSHHGAIVALGTVALGGETFSIARHGECLPGKENAFAVARVGPGTGSALFLWIEDKAGAQVCAPAQGDQAGGHWHFHVTTEAEKQPSRVVLRLRGGGKDERAGLSLHAGAAPRHDGVVTPLRDSDGGIAGWAELKLHDDKGDLELWLAEDPAIARPFDLPVDAVVRATFPAPETRTVELRVRNKSRNEDEDDKANIRNGKTHYFIFPGDTGADASWLQGAQFKSLVTLTLSSGGNALSTAPFVLVPHSHGPDGHKH